MRGIAAAVLAALVVAGCEKSQPPKQPVRPAGTAKTPAPPAKPVAKKSLMKVRLEREGHVLKDGRWFKKETWTWGANNLWEDDVPAWKAEGVELRTYWDQVTHRSVLGAGPGFPTSITGIRENYGEQNLKFFAPRKGKGTVTFTVDLPGDLITCTVKASSEIHWKDKAGSVRLTASSGGAAKELYFIEEGRNDVTYDVLDLIRGKTSLKLVAEIEEKTCRDTDNNTGRTFEAHARFLPSVKDRSRNVLAVTGTRLVPKPDLDAQWKEAR